MATYKDIAENDLEREIKELRHRLAEAEDTIDAIRSGSVDALVIDSKDGLQVYTLKSADHTYRILIEEMNEGALLLSRDGTILFCNRSFAKLLDAPHNQIIGESFFAFVEKDGLDINNFFREAAKDACKFECLLVSKSGKRIPVKICLQLFSKEEQPVLNMTVVDMTEQIDSDNKIKLYQNKLEKNLDELRRSNTDLEQFAYIASHDLMEPLRMVTNFTQLLLKHLDARDADSLDFQGFILSGISRMERMVKDLLEYSRVGRSDVNFETVDFNELLEKVKAILHDKIKETNTTINSDDLPSIKVIPSLMTQVFQNLIGNAIKFSKPDEAPKIHISVSKDSKHYEFCIKDNGIGIDEKFADRIFTIFQRLHTQDKYPGSGIGLAITKKIINFHGGKVWLKSKLGHGCVFHFTLPAKS